MEEILSRLQNHVVVVGFGSLGQKVAEQARTSGKTVLVLDRDPGVAAEIARQGYLGVQGSVSKDRILERVNIAEASEFVITINDPDRQLVAILMARVLNPDIHIVAAAYGTEDDWLTHAGASQVVSVTDVVAAKMLERLHSAGASDGSEHADSRKTLEG